MTLSARWFSILGMMACLECTLKSETPDMYAYDNEGVRQGPDGQPVKGAWSVTGDMVTGNVSKITSLQADFVPGDYTIQFNLEFDHSDADVVSELIVPAANALITWSVEGNQVTRRVSVGNGVSISGNAQAVRVVISDVTDRTFATTKALAYTVSATITKGTRPDVEQPPMLFPLTCTNAGVAAVPLRALILQPGDVALYPVPVDAGAVSVLVTVAATASAAPPIAFGGPITEQDVQVQQLGVGSLSWYDPRAFGWAPLFKGCTSVAIINRNAVNAIRVNLVFGIDG